MTSPTFSVDPFRLHLDALLAEYRTLREEILKKQDHVHLTYTAYIAALAAIYAFAFSSKIFDLAILTPILSLPFFLWLMGNERIIVTIGRYIERHVEPAIQNVVLSAHSIVNSGAKDAYIIGWEAETRKLNLKTYRAALVITFILLAFGPPVALSAAPLFNDEIFSKIRSESQIRRLFGASDKVLTVFLTVLLIAYGITAYQFSKWIDRQALRQDSNTSG